MAYVIAQPCIGTKDRACVEVCPVSCFYENEDQLFIHPQECIDCDACLPVCPVTAIFPEAQIPEEWKFFTQKAIDYFAENAGVPPAKSKGEVGSGGVAEGSTHWVWQGQAPVTATAPAPGAATTTTAPAPPRPAPAAVASTAEVREATPAPAPTLVHAAVAAATEAPAQQAPPKPTHEAPAPAKPITEAPPPAKPAEKAAPKAAPPPATPMGPEEYRQYEALLYQVLEMLSGSRPFDAALFSRAEETAKRLIKEVAAEFGKEVYTAWELEKKGMTLRQKHDLAQSLFQAVDRAGFIVRFNVKRRQFVQLAFGGAVTGIISVLSGVLSLQTVRIDSLIISPNPGLLELLQSFLNAESLIPFLAFQMIAGLMGLFTVYAILQCWRVSKEVHELRRAMQAKHIDVRMIPHLA